MDITVNAGTITAGGLRRNSSYLFSLPTGGSGNLRKVRIIELVVGDTIDWYHNDSTDGGTTYSGWWYIHKL